MATNNPDDRMNKVLDEIKELDINILRLIINSDCKDECNITPSQMRIIAYIFNKNGSIYQRDLERDLNLRRATLSGILNTMEKNKLLYRLPSDIDARSKKIILNDKTKDIFTKKMENLMEVENILIRGINKDELTIFLDIIDRMKNNVKKECDNNAKID